MLVATRTALRKLAAGFVLTALVVPSLAQAQSAPLPSYAHPAPVHESVTGTVATFDGHYALTVNDDRGFVDTVQLRDGTIINPTGLRIIEGMRVTVTGYTSGRTFVALQIDTPYTMSSADPPADGYAYGSGGYPYYNGYPYYYGGVYPWYYPVAAFGLGLAFGIASYYWGPYGYYGYRGCCGYRGYYGYGYRGGYYGYNGGYHGGYYNGYRGGYSNGYRGGYNSGYHGGYNGGYSAHNSMPNNRGSFSSAGHAMSGGFGGAAHGMSGGFHR